MKYLRGFFRYTWLVLDGLRKTLHLIVLLVMFGLLLAAATPHIPHVPASAALVIEPQGALVEQSSAGPLDRALAEASGEHQLEVQVRDVVAAIRHARNDARIKVLVLNFDAVTGAGMVKLEEIATAVREFRAAGKQVIALGQAFDQQQFYLAAQADQIYLDPHGWVLIEGFDYYSQYFKDALDKLGVTINVFKAGKFKSAVEPFIRQDMSPEAREANDKWLSSVWKTYQERVTQARGLDADALSKYVDDLLPALQTTEGNFAKLALDRKLVTDLKTREEVSELLKQQVGEDPEDHAYARVYFEDYLTAMQAERSLAALKSHQVGIVVAEGEIIDGEHTAGTIGGDSLAALLRDARFNDDIKAVVLRINSPGGSVMASEVIRREVAALKAAGKPVVASMSSLAASGGYYIAMDADEIWADPATITGSIGVFGLVPTFDKTLGKVGISTDGLGTTSMAGALRVDRPMSETSRKIFQLSVDHEYAQFVQHVADARKKSFAEIDAIAQGRVWSAADAATLGLVDNTGTLADAVKAAAARAQLGDDWQETYLDVALSWQQQLASAFGSAALRISHQLAPELKWRWGAMPLSAALQEMQRVERMAASRRVYLYCGCTTNL